MCCFSVGKMSFNTLNRVTFSCTVLPGKVLKPSLAARGLEFNGGVNIVEDCVLELSGLSVFPA